MPTPNRETLLCRYHYDPLDRLVDSTPFEQPTQRYYCKTRLATEIQDGVHRSILQHDDQLLAQQQRDGTTVTATLLATDQQRSVLNALDTNQPNPLAYSPYGHHPLENGLLSLLGFNGERPDPVTGHYHLGSGYRQFNPVLMRFNSPDSWSPFGEGGLNAYAYCAGDPINRKDPNGHKWYSFLLCGMSSVSTRPRPVSRVTQSISTVGTSLPSSPPRTRTATPLPSNATAQPAADSFLPTAPVLESIENSPTTTLRPFDFEAAYEGIRIDAADQAIARALGHEPRTIAWMAPERTYTDVLAERLPSYSSNPSSSNWQSERFVTPPSPPPQYTRGGSHSSAGNSLEAKNAHVRR